MKLIPFTVSTLEYNVMVILEPEHTERMQKADPAQIGLEQLGQPWLSFNLKKIIITSPGAEDLKKVEELIARREVTEALKFLSRGFEYRPDQGDTGDAYKSALR